MSTRTNKKWSIEEELAFLEYIERNPTNISQAIRDFAEEHDRSPMSVRNRYYKKLRQTSTCFIIATGKTVVKNTKNSNTNQNTTIKKSIFNKIKEIFKFL